MPLPNRLAHEQALTAAITAEYSTLIDQAKANPAGISWTASEDKAQNNAADEIATIYLLSLSGLSKETGQDFNQYVAIGLATQYANQRAADVVSNLFNDLRASVAQAARDATVSVANGTPADVAKTAYKSRLTQIFEPNRPDTIGVTETTAAISAGEYAVGKPDKNRWWLALLLLYGVPNAYEAWKNRQPGQPIRDLIGWPRTPRRRDLNEPAPPEWPTPTPGREFPKAPEVPRDTPASPATTEPTTKPGDEPTPQTTGDAPDGSVPPSTTQPTAPKFLNAVWETLMDERVCPICGPLAGQPESVWDKVYFNGPPGHPRCRCFLVWAED